MLERVRGERVRVREIRAGIISMGNEGNGHKV